jgi:hypothetical protein
MDHFEMTQLRERENIQILFDNYFQYNSCELLQLTSINGYSTFDALMISAMTKTVLMEYKRRNISMWALSDCVIEYPKYEKLYRFHRAGNHVYYIIEYDEIVCFWNLSTVYNHDDSLNLSTDYYFYEKACTATSAPEAYRQQEKIKLVRGLQFFNCEFFLKKSSTGFLKLSWIDVLGQRCSI